MASEKALMKTFDFNDRDLAYNRKGELSPRQRPPVQIQHLQLLVMVAAGAAFLNLALWAIGVTGTTLSIGVLIGIMLLAGGYAGWQISRRSQIQQPARLEGKLTLGTDDNPADGVRYWIAIDGQNFPITHRQYLYLERHPEAYRVYYLPELGRILSIEAL